MNTADLLEIRGIEVHAHHGVFAHERSDGQLFVIDLGLRVDTRDAAGHDDLNRTVDYGGLVEDVVSAVASNPVDLIETLAQRVAEVCLSRDLVNEVSVTVHKPNAPIRATFADVALTINRSRRD
ncbi:MAG TPA: dihydroneopterin aldolase [Marmoricola sp.]|nr:dihydroneopterin aldolase [Marmoricola sp.]HNI70594.1 dihydroneopterin aldolase [Marmoricola sp.]HNJ79293.1 dihydroneopterin aldolase [Marmoricola sp.]HNN49015.1 dihydroneopterin aldolase [Marmoricola sp.]HNO39929.1 dihydroneopterin aldolase [Marmoricola sp.]